MLRLLCLVIACGWSVVAQDTAGVLLRQTFDGDNPGWTAMGQGGAVRVENGALAFTFEVKAGEFAIAVLPPPAEVTRMRRLRFRVKTDHETALAVVLAEKKPGGGNYTAPFSVTANTWHTIELAVSDFTASDGPNDPVDADGKLDLDQVEGIGIADLAQFFAAQPENPDFPVIIGRATGTHTFLVDDFELLGSQAASAAEMEIDRFERGVLSWITMGGAQLKLADKGNPLGVPAMQATYTQAQGRYAILLRRLSNYDLSKATRIAFDVASEHEATLIVSLETKKGARYNLTVFPPGKREVFHVDLKLSDFDGPGRLRGADLKSMAITDIAGSDMANTIWLGRIEGKRE